MGNQTSTQTNTRLTAEDFDVLSLIGKGAFGKVWQVRKKDTGQIYAMKVLNKKNVVAENLIEHTKTEREVMLNLGRHPFIVNLNYAFQTDQQLFFILDYVGGGSLFQALSDSEMGCFSPSAVEFYAAEILLGLQALHSANIVYRDLKLENILLSSDGHVVLTDFGLSAKLKREQDKVHSFSGTAIYLAPEILADEKGEGHDMSVDWWGLGVMIFILLTGMPPFWSENHQELFDMIRTADLVIDDPNITPVAADLIRGLLKRNISERLGCGPEGALEVKNHPFFASINWDNVLQKKLSPPFIPTKDAAEEALKNLPQHEKLKIGKKKKEDNRFRGFSYVGQQGISPLRQVDERIKKQWAVAAGLSPEELEELEANAPEVETKVQFSGSKSKSKSKLSSSSTSSSSSSSPSKDPQAAPVSAAQMAMNKKSGPKGPSSFKDKRKSSPLAKSARAMLMAQGDDDDDDDDEDDDDENGSGVQIADPRSPPKASFAAPSPSAPKASFAAPSPAPKASFAAPSPAPKTSTSPARSSGLRTSTTASKGSGLKASTTASSLSASETKAEPVTIAAPSSPPVKESDETPKKEKTPSSPESRKKAKKVPSEEQIAAPATSEKKAKRTPSDDQAPSPAEDKKKTKKSKKSSSSTDLVPPSSPSSSEKKARRTPSDDQVGSPVPEKRTKKSSSSSSSSSSEEKTIKKSASEEKIATPSEEKKSKKSKKTVEDRSSASSSSDDRNKMKKASSSAELTSPRSSPLSPRSEDHKKKRSREKADPSTEETKEGKSHKKSSSSKDPEALLSPRSRKTKKSSDKAPA